MGLRILPDVSEEWATLVGVTALADGSVDVPRSRHVPVLVVPARGREVQRLETVEIACGQPVTEHIAQQLVEPVGPGVGADAHQEAVGGGSMTATASVVVIVSTCGRATATSRLSTGLLAPPRLETFGASIRVMSTVSKSVTPCRAFHSVTASSISV